MKRERIAEIAELLDKRGKLTLEQLSEHFSGVSQMTLRRDLLQLEKEGKIIRVRGGAMSVREAILSPAETLPVDQCVGRVLAMATVGCPPAVPIVVSGEVIDQTAVDCMRYYGIETCSVVK